mgnify:CR=1 FL=1
MGKEAIPLAQREVTGLQRIQDRLGVAVGLSALVTNARGEPITRASNLCSFCRLVNSTDKGRARCKAWRVRLAGDVAASGKRLRRLCHAGLAYVAAPVNVGDEVVAVVMVGKAAIGDFGEEEVARVAADLGIDEEELKEAARRVPVWSEKRLREAADLFHSAADALVQLAHSRQELQHKTEELSTIVEFGRAISSTLHVSEVARRALEAVLRLTGATGGSVVMLSEETEVAASVEPEDECPAIPGGELIAALMREARPMHYRDNSADGMGEQGRPVLSVPLNVMGKVTGVLTIAGGEKGASFSDDEARLLSALGTGLALALENARLYESLREYYMNGVRALAAALEAKDEYTRGHSGRVAGWARACARELGLSEAEQEHLYLAGLLHDIGKIGVGEEILLKAGQLTPEERREVESHPVVGARILEPAKFPREVIEAVLYHHEDYAGGGYPEGLRGEKIPLLARIVRVADAYDAMTSDRPYRKGHPHEWAMKELGRLGGEQFDPEVVRAFRAAVRGREGLGSEVDGLSPRQVVSRYIRSQGEPSG